MAERLTSPPPPREVHPIRFKLAYAALAVVLGAGVGTLIVLVGRGDEHQSSNWSGWQPDGSDTQKTREIAEHVGRQYRLPSGHQIVAVIPGPPKVGDIPIEHVAIANSDAPEDITLFGTDNSVVYQMCGLGRNCGIEEGTPSIERGYLLHREALELSLYSFKYAGADQVITLLPGRPEARPTYALFLRKDDFRQALDQPLSRTLRPTRTIEPNGVSPRESGLIRQIDLRHFYRYSFQQAPDGSGVLVLAPTPA
jgi:hypothetical protein